MASLAALEPARLAVRAAGRAFVAWANPKLGAWGARALAGWPLMELDEALVAAAVYAVIVLVGLIFYKAPSKAAPEKKVTLSVAAKFAKEPILYVQFAYNWLQVALCGYMMVEAARVAIASGYGVVCNPFDATRKDLGPVLWLFYVSKVLDFFDTIFMIARGNYAQFSFLHIYHHFSIFLTYWLVSNAAADGDVYYTIVANSFIHFVMYMYYGLTTINIKPSWGWIVTQAQLIQFVTMMSQGTFIVTQGCSYPHRVTYFYIIYILSLFMLFMQFNIQRWFSGGSKKARKE